MQNRLVQSGQSTIIPIQATGKLGDEFFDTPQYNPQSLKMLKKKVMHEELRDKGYLVDEKLPKEIPMDIPFYEVFDPPNENYMKIFHPKDLESKVAYFYHSPNFENNEVFLIPQEDLDWAESSIKQQQDAIRRKESKLYKLNKEILRKNELEAEIEKRMKQNEAIEVAKKERLLSKQPVSSPSKKQTNTPLPFKQYGLAIVGPKGKVTMMSQQKELQENIELMKQQQLKKQIEKQDSPRKKTVTFAEEDEIKYIPKNWKSQSEEFRNKMKNDKKQKKK